LHCTCFVIMNSYTIREYLNRTNLMISYVSHSIIRIAQNSLFIIVITAKLFLLPLQIIPQMNSKRILLGLSAWNLKL
jgi:hypothetical protein